MTRNQILARGLARTPHPMYGLLTGAKYNLLQILGNGIVSGKLGPGEKEQAWAVCVLDPDDPAIVAAYSDGGKQLEAFWREHLFAPDLAGFLEWYNQSWEETEASATEDIPDKKVGKSEGKALAPTG